MMQRLLYVDFGGRRPEGEECEVPAGEIEMKRPHHPDHVGGYRVAQNTFKQMESKFGLIFPKLSPQ